MLINIFNIVTTNSPNVEGMTAIAAWMLVCIFFVFFALVGCGIVVTIITIVAKYLPMFIRLIQVCILALEEKEELPEEKKGRKAMKEEKSPNILIYNRDHHHRRRRRHRHHIFKIVMIKVKKQSEEENKLRQMRKEDYRSKVNITDHYHHRDNHYHHDDNHYHQVDDVFLVVFPIMFLVFNLIYWPMCLSSRHGAED